MRSNTFRLPLRRLLSSGGSPTGSRVSGPQQRVNSNQSRSCFISIVSVSREKSSAVSPLVLRIETKRSLSERTVNTLNSVFSSPIRRHSYSSSPSSPSGSETHPLQISISFDAKLPPEELEHVDILGDCASVDPAMLTLR